MAVGTVGSNVDTTQARGSAVTDIDRYDYAFDPDGDAWAARLLRQLPPSGSVLELGPGSGAMTKVLVARGYQVTVVENDPQALEAMRALNVNTVEADLDQNQWLADLAGIQFDAVLACDVLEHLRDPQRLLHALSSVLKPQGRIVISVPNIAYAGVVAALRNGVFDYVDKGILDRTHVRFFTQRTMHSMLLDSGWSPQFWDAHRVPIAASELAWCWDALPSQERQILQSGWPEFDVYQWMVVATPPSGDTHAWETGQLRLQLQKMCDELYALKHVHTQEHASLLEHQKAFSEAKTVIDQLQKDMQQLRMEHDTAQEQWSAERVALQRENTVLRQKVGASLGQRLRRKLGLK